MATRQRIGNGLSRSSFLRRGAIGGGALVAAGSGLGAFAPAAFAAAPPDGDLAYLRLLIGGELLAIDFYGQAIARRVLKQQYLARATRIAADEAEHYALLAALMTAEGLIPTTADDIDFSYPGTTFRGPGTALGFAQLLEQKLVGSYIDALANVQTPAYRTTMAQILGNEARHQSALAGLQGRPLLGGPSLPARVSMQAMSDFLDRYES